MQPSRFTFTPWGDPQTANTITFLLVRIICNVNLNSSLGKCNGHRPRQPGLVSAHFPMARDGMGLWGRWVGWTWKCTYSLVPPFLLARISLNINDILP